MSEPIMLYSDDELKARGLVKIGGGTWTKLENVIAVQSRLYYYQGNYTPHGLVVAWLADGREIALWQDSNPEWRAGDGTETTKQRADEKAKEFLHLIKSV